MAFIFRAPPPPSGLSPLLGARIGGLQNATGFTGSSLVQAVVPLEAGEPLDFTIAGVEADVFPMTRHAATGEPDIARICALVPNPSGRWSIPGAANTDGLIEIARGPGFPAAAELKPVNLQGLTIRAKVANVSGTYEARPFEPGSPSILHEEIRRDGRYIKQTRTLCTLVRTGFTEISEKTDSVLLALVIRTTRSDFRAEQIDVKIANAKFSSEDDPWSTSVAGDGPVKFGWIQLLGYESQDTAELFLERSGTHTVVLKDQPGEYVNLVNTLPGWPSEWHGFYPGSHFTRRILIYRRNEVTQAIAEDICRKRDFAWSEGEIGYCNGKWAGYASVPRYLELPPCRTGFGSAAEALIGYASERESSVRFYFESGVIQFSQNGQTQAGWSKPYGGIDPVEAGEQMLDGMFIEAPGPSWWSKVILEADGINERQHLAIFNIETGLEATIGDITDDDGRLPYVYSGRQVQTYYRNAHFRYVDLGGFQSGVDVQAPDNLPWNSVPVGDSEPNQIIHSYQDAPFGNWNTIAWSHAGRFWGPVKAAFYGTDDAIAESDLRCAGVAALAGWHTHDPRTDGPWRRFEAGRLETNLFNAANGQMQIVGRGKASWPQFVAGTNRDATHCMTGVVTLFHLADSAHRTLITGDGDPDHDWFRLVATVIEYVTCENGMFTATGDLSLAMFNGDPTNFAARTGAIPGRPGLGTDQYWTCSQLFHQAYFAQCIPLIQERIESYPGMEDHLAKLTGIMETLDSSAEVTRPDGQAGLSPYLHSTFGEDGVANPAMTRAQARGADGYWFQSPSIGFKPWSAHAMVPQYFMKTGEWGGALNMSKRQFGRPSEISDQELLRRLWAELQGNSYQSTTVERFRFMALNLIGRMQDSGIRHPDFSA